MSSARGLKVVVIGATGNVGTSVVDALTRESTIAEIVGVARRPGNWNPARATFLTADVTRDDMNEIVRGADVVVHLAWLFQPTHRPRDTWNNNVLGAIRVFEAVAEESVPALVYASSVAAYSPGPSDAMVDERWPTHGWPTAAYPREKAYLERWLDAYETRHPSIRVVRMRPGFIFKRESATSQRRLFLGPLLARRLVHPDRIPLVPVVDDLRVQVLHTEDAATAYAAAVINPARGAFNLASLPPVDGAFLAEAFGARGVRVAPVIVRSAVAVGWHLHAVPASPGLFETVLQLPLMDCARARDELNWTPRHAPGAVLREFLLGLHDGAGLPTPPLRSDTLARRVREFATGVGQRA
ncbi:NAD-dependent epimerase/dehydratase family protein (plasmid) [Rhodococcus sp. USK10]|uniref:NAD-dependent epimerase/dehydratase family protein n=1 Tax=Rhodococcus sp. USK10 TaxID=2789739 RepID=UPI001C606B63|nr:NAD-dependent epimerase/dehydratase family protein [Rhodococcus sp. USK10]QYA99949.1 NAD-dependent epimerase/dehydratase family protein [Rhodococcus sp. USK10]